MNQFPAIERRVAQHCSHPHLEEAILAALAAEDKNLDQVRQASSATSVFWPTGTYSISATALPAHYKR